jgi:hypothetical protein
LAANWAAATQMPSIASHHVRHGARFDMPDAGLTSLGLAEHNDMINIWMPIASRQHAVQPFSMSLV